MERQSSHSPHAFDAVFKPTPLRDEYHTVKLLEHELDICATTTTLALVATSICIPNRSMKLIAHITSSNKTKVESRILRADLDTRRRLSFPEPIAKFFHAGTFLRFAVDYFDQNGRVKFFDADWREGENYNRYYRAVGGGADPIEAAATTWTARTLATCGFSPYPQHVQSHQNIQDARGTQHRPRIEARFPRLQ